MFATFFIVYFVYDSYTNNNSFANAESNRNCLHLLMQWFTAITALRFVS